MASLPPSVKSVLREVVVDRSTAQYGFDVEFTGYCRVDAPQADIEQALALVSQSLKPPSRDLVLGELARLKVTTKSRAENPEDLRIALSAYAEYLADYPGDIVQDALRYWARNEKWWPAWSELKDILDRRVKKRKSLEEALQHSMARKTFLRLA